MSAGDSVKGLLIATLCLTIGVMWFAVFFCGCITINYRCCPCLVILMPLTLSCGVILCSASMFKSRLVEEIDKNCGLYGDEIAKFFELVVDRAMCSDACPCDQTSFTDGGYDTLTNENLVPFNRKIYSNEGSLDDYMVFSRTDLDNWLDAKGTPEYS